MNIKGPKGNTYLLLLLIIDPLLYFPTSLAACGLPVHMTMI